MQPILVTSYTPPDLDGFADSVAYAELLNRIGRTAVAGIFGATSLETRYLLDRFTISEPAAIVQPQAYEQIILVDSSEPHAIDPRLDPLKVIEVIDHRKSHDAHLFPNAKIQIELVGSCATLITEKFHAQNLRPSRNSAILLYGAILSNTINFQNNVTTDRDRRMASWLNETLGVSPTLADDLFTAKSRLEGQALSDAIIGDTAIFRVAKETIAFAQLEVVGAEQLLQHRLDDIHTIFNELQSTEKPTLLFLSMLDLTESYNLFYTTDKRSQQLLSSILGITFTNNTSKRPGLMMRKEIIPLIKEFYGRKMFT